MEVRHDSLVRSSIQWWQAVIIGLLFIIFGSVAFFLTPLFVDVMVILFAVIALFVGVTLIIAGRRIIENDQSRSAILLAGILSTAVAFTPVLLPFTLATIFFVTIAFLAIINGALLILVGCTLSEIWKARILVVFLGMITLFIGIVMALGMVPIPHMLMKVWGMFAWVIGSLYIIGGFSFWTMPSQFLIPEKQNI